MPTENFNAFNESFIPEPALHDLEAVEKGNADLELIHATIEEIDEAIRDFTATGFQDFERFKKDLNIEERLSRPLGSKTMSQTKDYFIKLLETTMDELRLVNGNEAKVGLIGKMVEELKLGKIVDEAPEEDLRIAA